MECEPGRGDRLSSHEVLESFENSLKVSARVFAWLTPPRPRGARATLPLQGRVRAVPYTSPLLPVREGVERRHRFVRLEPLGEQMSFLVDAAGELFGRRAQQLA